MACSPAKPSSWTMPPFGYPIRYLRDVPPGEYYVQAVLNRYETFHRCRRSYRQAAHGPGEGQHWNISPGNLYSASRRKSLSAAAPPQPIAIVLDQEIPPIAAAARTPSTSATSRFKARCSPNSGDAPCFSAPMCWCPRASTSIPTRTFRWHHPKTTSMHDFDGFRTEPPDPNLKPDLQRALPHLRLQPHPAGGRVQVLSTVDRAELPAHPDRGNQSRQSLITTIPTR